MDTYTAYDVLCEHRCRHYPPPAYWQAGKHILLRKLCNVGYTDNIDNTYSCVYNVDMKYAGEQTKQAHENFPFPYRQTDLGFVYALAQVKKAAALANAEAGSLDKQICDAICTTCDEIQSQKHDTEFTLPAIQGGAGTSVNMNINEVIASRATEILQKKRVKKQVHANDHVNMSQSTNDANPSALRILCIQLSRELIKELSLLAKAFRNKGKAYASVPKLARTHIQDAVPTSVGEEMNAYASLIEQNTKRIEQATGYLYHLNLGGTAVGNGINASPQYRELVYQKLGKITGLSLYPTDNLMAGTSSAADICFLNGAIYTTCTDISKIAKDIRVLSSGPRGGIGEIILEPLQPGSSIMPGKINPVLPEAVNQLFYLSSGYTMTIHQATHGANLELNVMFPVIADTIITHLRLSTAVFRSFRERCIQLLKVNEKRCREHLENSTAYATLLTPVLGYDTVSKLVKEAITKNVSIRDVIVGQQIMSENDFEKVVNPK